VSIYGTWLSLPDDDDGAPLPAPIVYHHSGHLPDPSERAGYLEVGVIPGCACGLEIDGREADYDKPCPFLRLGVSETDKGEFQTVVLDAVQVRELYQTLGDWLERIAP
jgi:hypothetical protein